MEPVSNCDPKSISMFTSVNRVVINGGEMIQNIHTTGSLGFRALTKEAASSAFHNARQEFDFSNCYPNTPVAVLDRIKDWISRKNIEKSSVLWLYGAPGAGKSYIARSIAEWCEDEKFLLASFFFSRSDSSRNHIGRFIATLAYAIAVKSVPECRSIIEQVVESDPHIFSLSLETQIHRLILEPLSMVAQSATFSGCRLPHVIVIDGLDECIKSEERAFLVRLLSSTLSVNPSLEWRILLSSRPEKTIQCSFDHVPMLHLSTRLAISDAIQERTGPIQQDAVETEQFTNEDTRKHDSKSESNGPPQMVSKTIQPAGIVINDAAYHGIEISGADTCVENFPGFDFSSAGVINTSAFRGAKITGGRVSNFGRASSA